MTMRDIIVMIGPFSKSHDFQSPRLSVSRCSCLKALLDGCATSVVLANAIQTTSSNCNRGCNMSLNADVNYEPKHLRPVINKHDELINALSR